MRRASLARQVVRIGVALVLCGAALAAARPIREYWWFALPAAAVLAGAALGARAMREWRREARARRPQQGATADTARLTEQLFGAYSPYVIEAACALGAARDAAAVPALCRALENAVAAKLPGYEEVVGALAEAVGEIGDTDRLPLLRRIAEEPALERCAPLSAAIARLRNAATLVRGVTPCAQNEEPLLQPAAAPVEDCEAPLGLSR